MRVLIILCLLPVFNYIYVQFFWEEDLRKYDAHVLLDLWQKQDTCELLYFGESSNFSYHPDDTQRYSISTLISHASGIRTGSLNKGAYHAGIFLPLIQRIESESVKYVVVTLNLRTLNQATIHAPIETSLQKQARLFRSAPALWNRFLLTLNAYDNRSLEDRDKAMWYEWTFDTLQSNEVKFPAPTIKTWCALPKFVDESGRQNMELRTLADHYIKAYAFQIKEDNPRIAQFDEIIRICREKGITVVLNLLAENVERAEELLGDPLVYLMRKNRDFLKNRFEGEGVYVVDNLEKVSNKHFTDQNWTTEHYDQVGRQIIADQVADLLSRLKKGGDVTTE